MQHSILIAESSLRDRDEELFMMHGEKKIARRNFFSQAAVFATWTHLARGMSRASEAPRTIGLGFSLYGMRSLTIDSALRAVDEIGYDCIELPVMAEWPADSARFTAEA